MPQERSALGEALARKRAVIVEKWLDETLQSYPEPARRFLLGEKDPFRNPVRHAFAQAFPLLFDALVQGSDLAGAAAALDGLVHLRAVQTADAGEAVAFLPVLKRVIRDQAPEAFEVLAPRVDELVRQALAMYAQCRHRLAEIKAREARRRVFVLERIRLAPAARGGDA